MFFFTIPMAVLSYSVISSNYSPPAKSNSAFIHSLPFT